MGSRLELQNKLEQLLGTKHVYYQPPEPLKMEYPAIIYSKGRIETKKADNSTYLKNTRYDITVIDKRPDNPVIDKLMTLPYCSYDRQYKSGGLNHDVLTLYY
nr:hypothetical protein [uncultured Blautia sp.]